METLHIPENIRFECSGCGNCCLQWPVPATADDVVRIQNLAGQSANFQPLHAGDQRYRGFTHTLEKRNDGKCEYLSQENRCRLHSEHGEQAKPAMCRLFPHAFSKTPSGVYAYVSFSSSGVLFNQGRLLSEQRQMLEERYALYKQLFPGNIPDWSQLQILDGYPLAWDNFLKIEEQMMHIMSDARLGNVLDKLEACSHVVAGSLPDRANPEKMPPLEAAPDIVDQIILKHLARLYLPGDVFNEGSFDLDSQLLMMDIIEAPSAVSLGEQTFAQLSKITLGKLDEQTEDLLQRFVYARLFAKLYCGPNLAHLSLLAGIHHLSFVLCLARLYIKLSVAAGRKVEFLAAAEIIRTIERRLSQMNFSPQSGAVMEVLLSSPARLPRIRRLGS